MGAKVSAEMLAAKELVIAHGMSAYEAAKVAGITKSAIYVSKWYKEFKHAQQTCNCAPKR